MFNIYSDKMTMYFKQKKEEENNKTLYESQQKYESQYESQQKEKDEKSLSENKIRKAYNQELISAIKDFKNGEQISASKDFKDLGESLQQKKRRAFHLLV